MDNLAAGNKFSRKQPLVIARVVKAELLDQKCRPRNIHRHNTKVQVNV